MGASLFDDVFPPRDGREHKVYLVTAQPRRLSDAHKFATVDDQMYHISEENVDADTFEEIKKGEDRSSNQRIYYATPVNTFQVMGAAEIAGNYLPAVAPHEPVIPVSAVAEGAFGYPNPYSLIRDFLKARGISVLVFDFDQTLLRIHGWGSGLRDRASVERHDFDGKRISPSAFYAPLLLQYLMERFAVVIASFGSREAIATAISVVLPQLPVCNILTPESFGIRAGTSMGDKNRMLSRVATSYKIGLQNIAFFDDDGKNIAAAISAKLGLGLVFNPEPKADGYMSWDMQLLWAVLNGYVDASSPTASGAGAGSAAPAPSRPPTAEVPVVVSAPAPRFCERPAGDEYNDGKARTTLRPTPPPGCIYGNHGALYVL